MDRAVAFVIDAPLTLSEGETATSRVQIAKTGKFKDPRYGAFTITRADFEKWKTNFTLLAIDGDRAGLPVDVDHSPEKEGKTEASGWILSIDNKGQDGDTDTPDEMWAVVEWNSLGVELIKDKRYRYLSPSYAHNKADETGKTYGTALVGVGMTNRPFLAMATVSLSEAPVFAEQVADEPKPTPVSDSRERMALSKDTLTKLSLADDATDEQIDAAIKALDTAPAKTLDQLAGENGKVVLDASEYGALKANGEAGKAAADELKATKFTTAWDKALDAGKVTPAQLENFTALYEASAETTLTLLDGLQPVVNVAARGRTGEPALPAGRSHSTDAEGDELDESAAEVETRAMAIGSEKGWDLNDPGKYQDAIVLAAAELGGR